MAYSFSPVDSIPQFSVSDPSTWEWKHFYAYFEEKHKEFIGPVWSTAKQKNAKKKIIVQSYEFWGKEVFKEMIDWVFANYTRFPQWQEIHIGLICGAHGWAKFIGAEAKKQIEHDRKWNK